MKPVIGLCLTGSFCTVKQVLDVVEPLTDKYNFLPVVSPAICREETRFFARGEIIERLRSITGKEPITTLAEAEPIGPKKLLDLLVIAPCTGNTLSKLALGITDTAVTLAAKAHLRNRRALLLAPATNDALGAGAKNLGLLLNTKNVYFVPFSQDDPKEKENSLISHFDLLEASIDSALQARQLQPILL